MAIKYTDDQLLTIKSMMEICGRFADHILHIMQNHGLDKVKGTCVKMEIDPDFKYVAKQLEFGKNIESDSGYIKLTRGLEEETYGATGKNSHEYEVLFAPPEVAERISRILKNPKPVPPFDIWIGDDRNDPPLDCNGREIRFDDCQPGKIGGV